jgi:hypothetical protein
MRCERATPDEGRRPEGNDSPGRVIVQVKERVRSRRHCKSNSAYGSKPVARRLKCL